MVVDTFKQVIETYTNVQFPYLKSLKKEKFNEDDNSDYYKIGVIIGTILGMIVMGYAIYLSTKCSNGFSTGQFILAYLFAPFYILYHLFATKLCGTM